MSANVFDFRPAEEIPRPGIRYAVLNADGKQLGVWDTREQAESFLHPGFGRRVKEVPPLVDDIPSPATGNGGDWV